MDEKIPCTQCGALILPATARKNDGLCMPCRRGERKGYTPQKSQPFWSRREGESPEECRERIDIAYRRGIIDPAEYDTALFCDEIRLTGPVVQGDNFCLQMDFHNRADHDIWLDCSLETDRDIAAAALYRLFIADEAGSHISPDNYASLLFDRMLGHRAQFLRYLKRSMEMAYPAVPAGGWYIALLPGKLSDGKLRFADVVFSLVPGQTYRLRFGLPEVPIPSNWVEWRVPSE